MRRGEASDFERLGRGQPQQISAHTRVKRPSNKACRNESAYSCSRCRGGLPSAEEPLRPSQPRRSRALYRNGRTGRAQSASHGKAPTRTKRRHGLLTSSHFFTKLKKFSSLFNAVGYAAINDELRVGARRHRSTEIARRSGPLRPRVQHAPLTQGWPLTSAREASRLV